MLKSQILESIFSVYHELIYEFKVSGKKLLKMRIVSSVFMATNIKFLDQRKLYLL